MLTLLIMLEISTNMQLFYFLFPVFCLLYLKISLDCSIVLLLPYLLMEHYKCPFFFMIIAEICAEHPNSRRKGDDICALYLSKLCQSSSSGQVWLYFLISSLCSSRNFIMYIYTNHILILNVLSCSVVYLLIILVVFMDRSIKLIFQDFQRCFWINIFLEESKICPFICNELNNVNHF